MFCSFTYCPRKQKLIYPDDGFILDDGRKYHIECYSQKRAEKIKRDDLLPQKAGALA